MAVAERLLGAERSVIHVATAVEGVVSCVGVDVACESVARFAENRCVACKGNRGVLST